MLVEGVAGIGKTALIERFLAPLDDLTVLRASGDESERDLPFGVLEQLFRRAGEAPQLGRRPRDRGRAAARPLGALDDGPGRVVIDDAHGPTRCRCGRCCSWSGGWSPTAC